MYKFNSTSVMGRYIKQLLHDFNLPTCKIYTKAQQKYADEVTTKINQLELDLKRLTSSLKAYDKNSTAFKEASQAIDDKTELLEYLKTHRELNVIPTICRDSAAHYPSTYPINNQQTYYPKIMTYVPYIKNGMFQEYINNEWINCHDNIFKNDHAELHKLDDSGKVIKHFLLDKPSLNYTKNLVLDSDIYDTYTHEYLGDYLRFYRDYYNINLMPLYNCFSNNVCNNLDLNLEINTAIDNVATTITAEFKSDDPGFKIYAVPVKLFQSYTIAMECPSCVEMFVGLYNKYLTSDSKYRKLWNLTYKFLNCVQFHTPVVYDKLVDIRTLLDDDSGELIASLGQNESNLKLFIKVPTTVKTSIVVLEGDYSTYTDSRGLMRKTGVANKTEKATNTIAYNYEHIDDYDNFKFITPLQLLRFNTKESYPFADKLVEYLTDQAITSIEENGDNIKRVKTVINRNTNDIIVNELWDDRIPVIIYEYINDKCNTTDINHDILGYVDSTVEKNYKTNYLPRLYAALDVYNDRHGTDYSVNNLPWVKTVPEMVAELIQIDPKLAVLNATGFDTIDDSIASVDIYD